MSQFEFIASIFGLLIGLCIAEVMGGFGKAVKARERLRIGWLTPLLGLLVMIDLTSFWTVVWSIRDLLPVNSLVLMGLLAFTALYYLAANLVFPEDPDRCSNFDDHYWANKRLVLGAMLLLNSPAYLLDWVWSRERAATVTFLTMLTTIFLILLTVTAFAKGERTNRILLCVLIFLYPFGAIASIAGW